jgi:hypothetical protein
MHRKRDHGCSEYEVHHFPELLVSLDGLVNLFKLTNTRQRNSNYEQILRMLDAPSTGGSWPGVHVSRALRVPSGLSTRALQQRSRNGDDYLRKTRMTVSSLIGLLTVLEQDPGADWSGLVPARPPGNPCFED